MKEMQFQGLSLEDVVGVFRELRRVEPDHIAVYGNPDDITDGRFSFLQTRSAGFNCHYVAIPVYPSRFVDKGFVVLINMTKGTTFQAELTDELLKKLW